MGELQKVCGCCLLCPLCIRDLHYPLLESRGDMEGKSSIEEYLSFQQGHSQKGKILSQYLK